ncbi:hypothetical protein [Variovorax gossypii]
MDYYDLPTLFYMAPPCWLIKGHGMPFPLEAVRAAGFQAASVQAGGHRQHQRLPSRGCFEGLGMESLAIDYTVGGAGPTGPSAKSWSFTAGIAKLSLQGFSKRGAGQRIGRHRYRRTTKAGFSPGAVAGHRL